MKRWLLALILLVTVSPATAWWQSRDSNYNVNITSGGSPATAFDPTTAFGQLAFSNSNRTVAHTGGGNTNDGVWTVSGTTTNQKVYVETSIVGVTFSLEMGFANDKTLVGNRFGGSNVSPTKGWLVSTGGAFACLDSVDNNTTLIPVFTTGDTVDYAFDTSVLKGWVRKNGGAWNASIGGTQDPATNQGGVATTITGGGPYFFFYGADGGNGDQVTATFASGSWARSAPAGFTQLQ